MDHRIKNVAVLIPARNEEALLPACIHSVLKACCALPGWIQCEVVVAVDSSTDQTYRIAKSMLSRKGRVLTINAAAVGAARAAAAAAVLERYTGDPAHCWLANTDADCRVPENWLTQQLLLARNGVQAVAGIVEVADFSEHPAGVERMFREAYTIRPDGTHPHVHGANIGIRADIYLRAGGWSHHATGEDHDLWRRVSSSGCAHHSVAKLKVTTSGRKMGRAPSGFASALAAHDQAVA